MDNLTFWMMYTLVWVVVLVFLNINRRFKEIEEKMERISCFSYSCSVVLNKAHRMIFLLDRYFVREGVIPCTGCSNDECPDCVLK